MFDGEEQCLPIIWRLLLSDSKWWDAVTICRLSSTCCALRRLLLQTNEPGNNSFWATLFARIWPGFFFALRHKQEKFPDEAPPVWRENFFRLLRRDGPRLELCGESRLTDRWVRWRLFSSRWNLEVTKFFAGHTNAPDNELFLRMQGEMRIDGCDFLVFYFFLNDESWEVAGNIQRKEEWTVTCYDHENFTEFNVRNEWFDGRGIGEHACEKIIRIGGFHNDRDMFFERFVSLIANWVQHELYARRDDVPLNVRQRVRVNLENGDHLSSVMETQ